MQVQLTEEAKKTEYETLAAMDELIKNFAKKVESLKDEMKKARENLSSALESDTDYRYIVDQIKELQSLKKAAKARIMAQPEVYQLSAKLDDIREEKKEAAEAFSEYIFQYEKKTGGQLPLFQDQEGNDMLIVKTAKLKKIAVRKARN